MYFSLILPIHLQAQLENQRPKEDQSKHCNTRLLKKPSGFGSVIDSIKGQWR